jgi:uncharacterized protein YktA (UPF0223 family)
MSTVIDKNQLLEDCRRFKSCIPTKTLFAQFSLDPHGRDKTYSKHKSSLSKSDYNKIEDIKEDKNCGYNDNYDDPFYK